MRFVFSVIVWVITVGGLWLYIAQRDGGGVEQGSNFVLNQQVERSITVALTPTFTVERDPFALAVEDVDVASVSLRVNGNETELPTTQFARGVTVEVSQVEGLVEGSNEVYVMATPPVSEASLKHGMRIQVLLDQWILADQTIWAETSSLISGSIQFNYTTQQEESHDH